MTGTFDLRSVRGLRVSDRMLSELEQAHVTAEDLEQRLNEAIATNRRLEAELREERRKRDVAERELAAVQLTAQAADQKQTGEAELRQQLSITIEELQVMAEELEVAQDAIRRLGGGS